MNNKIKKINGGISLIGMLILGFIIILILSYYKISLKSVVESPVAQDNIQYVQGQGRDIWTDYLQKPADYLWNKVFKDILWASFINNMERIRDGKKTELEEAAPVLNIKN